MSRKARRRTPSVRTTAHRAWEPWMRNLFRLAPEEFSAPAQIRMTHGHRKDAKGAYRCTYVARFTAPDGRVETYTTRCRIHPKELEILEETIATAFRFKPSAVSQ